MSNEPNPTGLCMCGCGEKTRIAPYTKKEHGYVKGQPRKYILGHKKKRGFTLSEVLERLDYSAPGGCWIWTGSCAGSGYGQIKRDSKPIPVHRFVYEGLQGPIPDGYHLHHTCKVLTCANPAHLTPLSPSEHMRAHPRRHAMLLAERQLAKTHCPQGHEYTPENTYSPPSRPNSRCCRTCHRERQQRPPSVSDVRVEAVEEPEAA